MPNSTRSRRINPLIWQFAHLKQPLCRLIRLSRKQDISLVATQHHHETFQRVHTPCMRGLEFSRSKHYPKAPSSSNLAGRFLNSLRQFRGRLLETHWAFGKNELGEPQVLDFNHLHKSMFET